MTCILKPVLIFTIPRNVGFIWERTVKNATRTWLPLKTRNKAKISISAHELQRGVCELPRISSPRIIEYLLEFKARFCLFITAFLFSKSVSTEAGTQKESRSGVPAIRTNRGRNVCVQWRRDMDGQQPKEMFSPNIVYWLQRGAQSCFCIFQSFSITIQTGFFNRMKLLRSTRFGSDNIWTKLLQTCEWSGAERLRDLRVHLSWPMRLISLWWSPISSSLGAIPEHSWPQDKI